MQGRHITIPVNPSKLNNVVLIYRVLHPTHIHHMCTPNMR
jgi:hypothetical protein